MDNMKDIRSILVWCCENKVSISFKAFDDPQGMCSVTVTKKINGENVSRSSFFLNDHQTISTVPTERAVAESMRYCLCQLENEEDKK